MLKIDLTDCLGSPHKLHEQVKSVLDAKAHDAVSNFSVLDEAVDVVSKTVKVVQTKGWAKKSIDAFHDLLTTAGDTRGIWKVRDIKADFGTPKTVSKKGMLNFRKKLKGFIGMGTGLSGRGLGVNIAEQVVDKLSDEQTLKVINNLIFQLNGSEAAVNESLDEASAWTPKQTASVKKLDDEFDKLRRSKNLDRYSKEASDLWDSAGFKGKMRTIFSEDIIDESRFQAITGSGVRGLNGVSMALKPNMFVYMGASSSPDGIFITKIDDKYISYLNYPYGKKEFKIETAIGRELIHSGTNTWLNSGYTRYHPDTAKKLQAILDGKSVKEDDVKDYRYVEAKVSPTEAMIKAADKEYGGDVWRYIENKLQIGVSGATIKEPIEYDLSGVVESDIPKLKKLFAKVKITVRKEG